MAAEHLAVMVKMDPPKLVPPRTNFLINKDPELILLKNLDHLPKVPYNPFNIAH